jgi:predicted metalloprotease
VRYREDANLDTSDVQDRRGGGGRALALGGGGLGVVGVVVVLLLQLLGGGGSAGSGAGAGDSATSGQLSDDCRTGQDANTRTECAVVADIDSIQDYWAGRLGKRYQRADTVFFSGSTDTGCGSATSGVGPFYCPADELVYIDLAFYDELQTTFGAEGGLFVDAYVLAHEYGHHVQDLLGTESRVKQGETGPTSGSVRLELQADCFAGTWANHATTVPDESGAPLIEQITADDIDRALDTAGRIGDDFIQRNLGGGSVDEQSFTHGTSAERRQWFTTGYRTGDPARCDTFGAADLG